VDEEAKLYREAHAGDPEFNDQVIQYAPWALFDSDNNKMLTNINDTLQELIGAQAAEGYWDSRNRFREGTSSDVDWEVTGLTMRSYTIGVRRENTKHASGFFANKKHRMRCKQVADNICPKCPMVEDKHHIYTCQHETNIDIWITALSNLDEWLTEQCTCPPLQKAIMIRLQEWAFQEPHADLDIDFPGLQEAIDKQDKLGWVAAFEGCWAKEIRKVQQSYLTRLGSMKTGRRWLVAVAKRLWKIAWSLWTKRNEVLYSSDVEQRHSKLRADIRQEFEIGFQGLPRSALPVTRGKKVQDILALRPDGQQGWLIKIRSARMLQQVGMSVVKAREKKAIQKARALARMRSSMGQWLKTKEGANADPMTVAMHANALMIHSLKERIHGDPNTPIPEAPRRSPPRLRPRLIRG
jgi:hypothetical protein